MNSLIQVIWKSVCSEDEVLGKTDVVICTAGLLTTPVHLPDIITMVGFDASVQWFRDSTHIRNCILEILVRRWASTFSI